MYDLKPRQTHRRGILAVALALCAFGLTSCGGESTPTGASTPVGAGASAEGYPSPGELRTGYIIGRDGRPTKVTFEVHDELAIIEGDIIIGRASEIATSREQLLAAPRHVPGGPLFGVVIDGATYRWLGGVVPYVVDPTLPNQGRITDAIANLEANIPGVNLAPRSGQADYIRFVPSTGCSSFVGRQGGVQLVNLATGCDWPRVMHEILHALGMWHEQSRCDRDTYVEILWANIQPTKQHNYYVECTGATDLFTYAEGSLMHYGIYDFSINYGVLPTMRSKRGLEYLMGQRTRLGSTDIATIKQIYPATTSAWVARSAMPTARKEFAAGTVSGGTVSGLLYAIGGMNGAGTVLTTVQAYSGSTNTWSTKASLPAARWRGNGVATINGVIYLAGGVDGTKPGHKKTLYAYNGASNSWSSKASMPAAGGCGGSGAISGILYVIVGCDSLTSTTSGAKGTLFRYDPVANTWSTKASSPSPHQFPAVAVTGGKVYVVGGKNGTGAATNVVHVYTPSTNTWTSKAPLPAARYRSNAQVVNGKVYVIGGNDAAGNYTNTVYVYDPASNVWSTAAPLPTARANQGGGVLTGSLYSVGGQNSGAAVLSTNDAFAP
jgi:N-acetylneuraminic acid mutarotase